jgi:hypothetical protein
MENCCDYCRVPRDLEKKVRSWIHFQFQEEIVENKVSALDFLIFPQQQSCYKLHMHFKGMSLYKH